MDNNQIFNISMADSIQDSDKTDFCMKCSCGKTTAITTGLGIPDVQMHLTATNTYVSFTCACGNSIKFFLRTSRNQKLFSK
jgi:hypothetical protein